MNIELQEIAVRDLGAGYEDKGDEGVVGYGGKLDIRPAYQREFIYKDKQREAVVDSVMNGFPLNVMYWARREDGSFEVMDGQQRTISLCQFAAFDDNTRLEAYERQHGVCPLCGAHFELAQMESDHVTPWRDGGRTVPSNCQMLCKECNRRKGAK